MCSVCEQMKNNINKRKVIIKSLISGAFFWVLFSFVQKKELIEVFSRINWFYFAVAFALSPLGVTLSTLKWKMILDVQESQISFMKLYKIYLVGYFFSNILPSTVGGDVVRSVYAGNKIENQAFSAVSVFLERFTGLFLLLILVILAPLLHHNLYESPYIYIPSFLAFALLLLLLFIWNIREPFQLVEKFMQKTFIIFHKTTSYQYLCWCRWGVSLLERLYVGVLGKLKKFHSELTTALLAIRQDRILFVKISALTILFYIFTWFNVYICFRAFGVEQNFAALCALVPTILFVAQIPVTILGNLGFFESVFVVYFLLLDIPEAESLAMGLLLRIKMLSLGLFGYFFYLSYSKKKKILFEKNDNTFARSIK